MQKILKIVQSPIFWVGIIALTLIGANWITRQYRQSEKMAPVRDFGERTYKWFGYPRRGPSD